VNVGEITRGFFTLLLYLSKKGKSVPLQALSDPEDSNKLKFPVYTTMAQDGW